MSVPTHNLYDFIHQVTEKKFSIMHFYPFGHKDFENIVTYFSFGNMDETNYFSDIPDHIAPDDKNNIALQIYSSKNIKLPKFLKFMPILMCNDQEPLNFDYYEESTHNRDYINDKKTKYYETYEVENTINLKWCYPGNLHKKWILLHSELNSKNLQKYIDTDEFVGAYWWSHALISRDWFRFAKYDTSLQPGKSLEKMFLIYSRDFTGSRAYRKKFLDLIETSDITSYQIGSFCESKTDSTLSATYNNKDINKSGISIVLETVFDERVHLTEKTLRPIACGHPFILVSGPLSLQTLKKYGFKTFAPWINESYDQVFDPNRRLELIVNEMQRIDKLSPEKKQTLLDNCKTITDYNKKHFFSNDFYEMIVSELKENINIAWKQTKNELNWKKLDCQTKTPPFGDTLKIEKNLVNYLKKGGTLEDYVPPDLD